MKRRMKRMPTSSNQPQRKEVKVKCPTCGKEYSILYDVRDIPAMSMFEEVECASCVYKRDHRYMVDEKQVELFHGR